MVATVSKLHGGNATYYTKGYYLNGEAEGEWLETDAAAVLRLAGKAVTPRAFERLLRGLHPEREEELVQNAGNPKRQLGWDVQFAVDKSFSALYALLPEIRGELEACLREAVRGTVLDVLEPEFLETRRGQGGKLREAVSSPVATFLHRTNRENEIHLHCHAPIPNVGVRQDGTTGTIVSWNFYDAKMALGKAFHARFAELAARRLGIESEFDEHGLSRVRGFPRPVAEALSTPSRTIAEVAEDESAKAKEEANLRARPAKAELPLEAVAEGCRQRATGLGFSEEDARAFLGTASQAARVDGADAARAVLRGVVAGLPGEFSKAQVFEAAFREGAKAGIPFAAVNEALKETLSDGATVEPLGRIGGKEQFRKLTGFEAGAAPLEGEASHEAELRELLKEIIATTPELDVAEFLPGPPVQGPELALSDLAEAVPAQEAAAAVHEEPVITPEDIRATLEPLGLARRLNAEAVEAFVEAARTQLERELSRDAPSLSSISLDTMSPALGAEADAEIEARRRELTVQESLGIPGERARSLLGQVVGRAREVYAERVADAAATRALGELMDREAHFTRDALAEATVQLLSGTQVSLAERGAAVDRLLADPSRVVSLGDVRGTTHYSTPEMVRAEEAGLRAAEALQARRGHAATASEVRQKLGELPAAERDAVAKALSGGDFVLVAGPDGLQMQAVQRGIAAALRENLVGRGIEWALGRKDVLWVAPTATAAQELGRSVGAEHVATLQKLLYNLDRGLGGTALHHATMVVNAALGRPTWEARQLELTRHTTVILDSASLVDTWQLSRLLQHAEAAGARVIACGTSELPSLGPGGFFRALRERSDASHVVTLAGEARKAVAVHPTKGPEHAKEALIERWAAEALRRPKDHTIVAASGQDVRELNAMAQAERKKAGLLGFRSIEVRYRLDGQIVKERIHEGDRVVFTARTGEETINGVFGTVKHIDLITGRIKVQLDLKEKKYLPWEFDRQKAIEFQYRNYRFFRRQEEGFRLGYAATVYRTQNVAVEGNSYCLLGGPDGAPSAVYAGLGLAKGTTHFFGDQVEERAELLEPKEAALAVRAQAEREQRAREAAEVAQRHGMDQGGMRL